MPEAKGQEGRQVDRENEMTPPAAEHAWPADLDLLFHEQEDLLGQLVAKSSFYDRDPSIALRVVRELVNRRLKDIESGAVHASSRGESSARIEDARRRAMIEAQGRARRVPSADDEKASAHVSIAALTEEMATFRDRLPELLCEHEGEFVLIKGTEIAGVFLDRSEALREGYRRFGIVPLLVRQIVASDPVVYLPNVVL